ncbi:MAG: T9SS type A sorting domain-containing protein [Flavobacteriales bacterium]
MRKTRLHTPLITACMLLFGSTHTQAQNITGYRYWFNDDLATSTVVDLSATPVLDQQVVLNSSALPAGHHLATLQIRDADGHWGAPWTAPFTQLGATVNAIEYWFNDEVDDATTASVTPGMAPLFMAPLDASALPVGFHTVTVRTIDAIGVRSVPYTVGFTRHGGAITGYEYWIDDAVADRVSNTIGPAGTVDLIAALPVPTTEGAHLFTIRFRDAEEGWSVPLSSTFNFSIGLDEIPGLSNYLLFPNPVSDELSLRLDADAARNLDLSVLDATGRTVQSMANWSVQGTTQRNWDISALARGSYLLRIVGNDRQILIPFVKQ